MRISYQKWLEDGEPIIYCQCGCGNEIIIKKRHKHDGIPIYIVGHINRGKHLTEEHIQKIRNHAKNNPNFGMKGKHLTKEQIQKMKDNKPNQSGKNNHNFGKHPSKETKQKQSNSHKNQIPWNKNKGWMTPLNNLIRNSNQYKEWRLQIFGRDNFTCQCCGVRGVYLEAHHIKPFNEIIKEYNIKKSEDALNCEMLWNLNNGITYCLECHDKLKKKGGILERL